MVDASNEDLDIQIGTTYSILEELEVLDKPTITVFNKMDKISIEDLHYSDKYVDDKTFISAMDPEDIKSLLEKIEKSLPQQYKMVKLKLPYDKQNLVNYFMTNYEINEVEHLGDGTVLKFTINQIDLEKYREYIID